MEKKHNIPSTILKVGDEITLKDSIVNTALMKEVQSFNKAYKVPTWLKKLSLGGEVIAEPTRDEMDATIRERLIIELYSR